ncbi:MAG TPA: helix-turn-helix domain-containing protein [Longimicrobium sp.]|nr:helix-turn-helix domain-containing protein [Longimicrobium sp.]
MDERFRKELEADGWRIGTVQEFLGLTDAEAAYIHIRHELGREFRARRGQGGMTQAELAELIGSSQSRVAKMEKGDPSVSLDLLIQGLLNIGATVQEIGAIIAAAEPPKPLNRASETADGSAAAAD